MVTRPVSNERQVRKRSAAVDRRMDHRGFASGVPAYIRGGVLPDRHHAGRARHQFRGARIGVPTGRPERKELRRVRQINDASGRGIVRFAEQRVAQIFR